MKRVVVIVSLVFAGSFVSRAQEICDTLKWKILKTYYTDWDGNRFRKIGELNGAVINTDTLSSFFSGVDVVYMGNDTFHSNETFLIQSRTVVYADTGIIGGGWASIAYYMGVETPPNDTFYTGVGIKDDLLDIINSLNVDLEDISYWQMIIGIGHTSKYA